MKIGLYLENIMYENVDLTAPEKGNPGIGGTQFNFITLAYYAGIYLKDYEFIILAQSTKKLPSSIKAYKVVNGGDAVAKAKDLKCHVFIFRPTPSWTNDSAETFKAINKYGIKSIAWEHNFPTYKNVYYIYKENNIKRYVMVSKETYDSMRDHPIIEKSQMINNGFDLAPYYQDESYVIKEKYITYLGRIDPDGFIRLMKIWPDIVKAIPDVKLKVIGSGKLYNRNEILGSLGVANKKIERNILKHVSREIISQTIEFLGLLGQEKVPILQKSWIGIVNPNGKENCPGAAIEFQACRTPVVSAAEWGLLETVENAHTGLLFRNEKDFKVNIIKLWNDNDLRTRLGNNGPVHINNKFNYQKICQEWRLLINDVVYDKKQVVLPINQNSNYRYKNFKENIRRLRRHQLLKYIPSSLFVITLLTKLKRHLGLI